MVYDFEKIRIFCAVSPGAVAAYQIRSDSIKMVAFSEGLPSLLGFSHKEYEVRGGGDITDLVVEQDRNYLMHSIETAISEERDVNCSYRAIIGEGEYHWMNVRGRYVGELEGCPVFLAEFLDTTQETQMHGDLLDSASNAIYVCDAKSHELFYANQKALDFWGRGNDFFGRTCHEFFRGRSEVCPWCTCEDLVDDPIYVERANDPDHEGHIKIGCRRLAWYGREAYCVTYDDITDERMAQEELRTIVDNIPAAIIVYREKDGVVEMVQTNGAIEEVAGLSVDEVMSQGNGVGIAEHVHPEDVEMVCEGLSRLFSDAHEAEFAYRDAPSPEAPYRWLHLKGRSYPQVDGTQTGYAVVTDITESIQAREVANSIVDIVARLPVRSLLLEYPGPGLVRPVSFSEDFCKMLGMTQQDAWNLYGEDALASVYPDDRPALMEYATSHIRANDTALQNLVHRFVRPDGGVVWVSASFSFFNVEGRNYGYMVYTDITALKKEEAEYRRRYLEEQSYLDTVSDAYIIAIRVNLTRNTVETASGTSPTVDVASGGISYDSLLMGPVLSELPRDADRNMLSDRFLSGKLIEAFERGEQAVTAEGQFCKQGDDDPIWARVVASLMRNPESSDIVSFITVESIEDEKLDKQIFDRMMGSDECDFVAIIDVRKRSIDFRRVADSSASKPDAGLASYDETLKSNMERYLCEPSMDDVLEALSIETIVGHLAGEGTYSSVFSSRDERSGMRRKLIRFSYIDKDAGKVLAIRTDITEAYTREQADTARLQQALRDAEAANVAKSDFLSRMSHDIRTPLNGIIGMTSIAKESDNPPATADALDKIETSSHFLLGLVNDILDLSKVESGMMELHAEPYPMIDFDGYIDSVIKPLYEEKNQRFVVSTTPVKNVIPIIDILRFNQIMFNLLSNAVKYTPEGGTISLNVINKLVPGHRERIIAEVKDSGIGISEEFQKVLFTPFTQEGRNDNSINRGSGLGLSIVKRLIDLMGGTISVQSEVGEGTVFTVVVDFDYIEADQHAWKEEHGKAVVDFGTLEGRHILLCEDHPLNQEIAVHILESRGMVVTTADDGRLGLKAFQASPVGFYDAILMDIRMPVMDGYETSRAIRALDRADADVVPIIAMTADAYANDVKACLEAGMDAHVAKPVDPDGLCVIIAGLLV